MGTGLSFEGFYGYLGPIVSYKMGWFEPYLLTRFNYVRYSEQKIDLASIGELRVAPGTPLARVHARTEDDAAHAAGRLRGAYTVGDVAPRFPLVVERLPAEVG